MVAASVKIIILRVAILGNNSNGNKGKQNV